jgi:hypothetical protein
MLARTRARRALPLKTLAGSAVVAATVLAGAPSALAATNPNPPANSQKPTTQNPTTQNPTAQSGAAKCDTDAHWPGYVQGRPDGFDAHDDGAYMWHGSGGWSVRVSHPVLPGKANRVVFTGAITSRGQIGHVTRVRNEKNDMVKVVNNGHTLEFRFVNFGGIDGVDFRTTCTPGLAVGLRIDKSSLPTKFIHLGDKKVHPGSNPFGIRRRDNDTTTVAPSSSGSGATSGAGTSGTAPGTTTAGSTTPAGAAGSNPGTGSTGTSGNAG